MYRERHVDIQNLDAFTNQLEFIIPDLMNRSWAFITFSDAISVVFHRLNFTDVVFCQTIYSVVASKVLYPNAMYVKRGSPIREILNTRCAECYSYIYAYITYEILFNFHSYLSEYCS